VGMGAVAGAVLGAPISTILMVFELTGNYEITIAVMIGTAVASLITQQVFGHSFFTWQLACRGLDVKRGRSQNLLRSILVSAVMKMDHNAVSPSALMIEVRGALQNSRYGEIFVVDDDGRLHGTITLPDLSDSAFDTELDAIINAEDVARLHPPVLTPDDTLDDAMSVMDAVDEEHIAVVEDKETMMLVGFVHKLDVVTAYNQAVLETRAEEQGGG
jgi:CIC family chloride channel protein